MVTSIDRSNYRITHSPFSNIDFSMLTNIEGLVLSVHVAEDETRVIEGFDGYDIRINIDGEYDGLGTLYLVDLVRSGGVFGSVGIGISDAA